MTEIFTRIGLGIGLLVGTAMTTSGALPVVNVFASKPNVRETTKNSYPQDAASFIFVSDQRGPLAVKFEMAGTAILGTNYELRFTTNFTATIPQYTNAAAVTLNPIDDGRTTPDRTIVARILPDPSYTLGDAALAGILLKTLPPPTISITAPNPQYIAADRPLVIGGSYTGAMDAVEIFVDDSAVARAQLNSPDRNYTTVWTNPTPGDHVLKSVSTNSLGETASATLSIKFFPSVAFPAISGSALGANIYTNSTIISAVFRTNGDSFAFIEMYIPPRFTNLLAYLRFEPQVFRYPIEVFGYSADFSGDTNDLSSPSEFLGVWDQPIPWWGVALFDVTSFVHRHIGEKIGIKMRIEPTLTSAEQSVIFYNLAILGLSEGEAPGRVRIAAPRTGSQLSAANRIEFKIETDDPDNAVKLLRLEGVSGANSMQIELAGLNLSPGSNLTSLYWTNPVAGQSWNFTVRMQTDDGVMTTNSLESVLILPADFGTPENHRWLGTDGGGYSVSVVLLTGDAFVWGRNDSNQLGLGTKLSGLTAPVSLPPPPSKRWRQITQNMWHSLELTDDGEVYTTGPRFQTPFKVSALHTITRISINEANSYALDTWGNLFQFNDDTDPVIIASGVREVDAGGTRVGWIKTGEPWTAISVASIHTLLLDGDGQMYAYGWNTYGQYPMESAPYSSTPLKAPSPPGATKWTKIAAGERVSLAVDDRSRLFAWGQQGWTGSAIWTLNTPNLVDVPETGWLDISVGKNFALALSATGKLYYWGTNPGTDLPPINVPTLVQNLPNVLGTIPSGPALALNKPTMTADGLFSFNVVGATGSQFKLQSSPDTVHWTNLISATVSNGNFQYTVAGGSTGSRFVKITSMDAPENP